MERKCGVLLPLFSLPSPYGIGTMGKEAFRFIDFLEKSGQRVWQVLPLGPTGFGDSPYQSFSSFAGNPYFIDIDILKDKGLLTEEDTCLFKKEPDFIDYGELYTERYALLKKAFQRFSDYDALDKFLSENPHIRSYSLFMTIKNKEQGKPWQMWEKELKSRDVKALKRIEEVYKDSFYFYAFLQYEFFYEWKELKNYASSKGIEIIGDIPIYTALDSCDLWENPQLFLLDENYMPTESAGVPPDYFNEDGQKWGNPLYNWGALKKDNYLWWRERLSFAFSLYDFVRIDHFRGLESFYAIDNNEESAKNGRWIKGPGEDFIKFLKTEFKDKNIIAEDLGFLTKEVRLLLKKSGFPGMKVLQFAFTSPDSDYLPHRIVENSVAYTGTHDNDTTMGFLRNCSQETFDFAREYLKCEGASSKETAEAIMDACLASPAFLSVIPMQDWLFLGSEARINTPATDRGNWKWRLSSDDLNERLSLYMMQKAKDSKRYS